MADSDVLVIWTTIEDKRRHVRVTNAKFRVGQHVRIRKENMKFAKGAERNFSTEIFRIANVIEMYPRTVHELEDLKRTQIDCQFQQEELTPVRVSRHTAYKIKFWTSGSGPAFWNMWSAGEVIRGTMIPGSAHRA